MDFTIKVYVTHNGNVELNYVTVPLCYENQLAVVMLTMQQKFPILLVKRDFEVSWRDADNDLIKITNDEELAFAFSQMPKMKKLVVVLDETSAEVEDEMEIGCSFGHTRKRGRGSSSRSSVLHPNIICDACDSVVYGFRYKCLICSNFDLCQKCEGKHNHANHFMLRIPVPIKGIPIDLRGSSLGNWLALNASIINNEGETSCSKKYCKESKSCDGKDYGKKHRGKKVGCRRHRHSELLKTFSEHINNFTNLAGDIILEKESSGASTSTENKKTEQTENQNKGATENKNSFEKHSNMTLAFAESINSNVNSFCNLLGNVIETVLAPHGVEVVDVYFDNQKPQQSSTENEKKSNESQSQTDKYNEIPQQKTAENVKSAAQNVGNVLSDDKIDESVPEKSLNNDYAIPINNSMNEDYGIFIEKNIDSYDSDSDSSGCVVEDSCGWTLLNTEDDKNEKPSTSNKEKESEEKDMEKFVEEFKKQMEVSEENKSGSGENIPNVKTQHSSEETRFVLVPDSVLVTSTESIASSDHTPMSLILTSESVPSTTTSIDSSQVNVSSYSGYISPTITSASAPETNISTTSISTPLVVPSTEQVQHSYAWPGYGLNPNIPPPHIDAPMQLIPPSNPHIASHMTPPFVVPPTTSGPNPFSMPINSTYYSNPPNHTYPPMFGQSIQNVRSTGQQTSIQLPPQPRQEHPCNVEPSSITAESQRPFPEVMHQLLMMGYKNDNGILEDIILGCRGNINAALDFLSSIR